MPPQSQQLFLGRDRELEELRRALADARDGRGHCYLIAGEPGIGKTRLAEEAAALAQRDGFVSAWGRCWEGGGTPAFWPWAQALRRLSRTTRTAQTVAAWEGVAAWISESSEVELTPSAPPRPERSRLRLFEGVASLVEALAATQPLLLVFDDVHAADGDSLELLRFVSRELSAMHCTIVATYRESEVARVRELGLHFADLARDSRTIALRGISEEATAEFVRSALETVGWTSQRDDALTRLARRLHEITEGSPFFLQEIVRELLLDGTQDRRHGDSFDRLQLPAHVRNAIRRRLAPLAPETIEVLSLAAVVGREFDRRILERVPLGLPSATCDAQLREAALAGVIQSLPDSAIRFRFAHALIRETLYEDLSPARRAELHHAIGRAIEGMHSVRGTSPIPALVHHFLRAVPDGAIDRAVEYTHLAARQATAVFAYDEAISHWRRALAALDAGPLDGPRDAYRCELLLGLGEALNTAAKRRERVEVFREAAEIARKLRAPDLLGRAALGCGGDWQGMSEVPKSDASPGAVLDDGLAKMLRESLAARGDAPDALRARLSSRLAVETYFSSPIEERERLTAEALRIARGLDDPVTLANVLSETHVALWGPHNVGERYAMSREIVRLAQQNGLLGLEAGGRAYCVSNALEQGDREALQVELVAFRKLAEQSRLPHLVWAVKVYDTLDALMTGRYGDAEGLAFETLDYGLQAERPATISFGLQLTALRREQDRLDEIIETVGMVKSAAEHYPSLRHLRASLAAVYADLGRIDEARENLVLALPRTTCDLPLNLSWLTALTDLTDACAALGDLERAAAIYAALAPYERHFAVSPFCSTCSGSVARSLGILATMLGRWQSAERHFEVALQRNRALDAHPWVAYSQLAYAQMIALRARGGSGDRSDSARTIEDLLHEARARAGDLGMTRLGRLIASFARDEQRITAVAGASVRSSREPTAKPLVDLDANLCRRHGDYWTVRYAGTSVQLKNARGLDYLATLLRHPGREFSALDLVGSADRGDSDGGSPDPESGRTHSLGDAGFHLDAAAKAAYRKHLAELRDDLAEAERFNDGGRVQRLRAEMDHFTRELSRAVGLGGRDRRVNSHAERARISVTRAIARALKSIAQSHSALGEHLDATIRTGTFCCYRPDPRSPVTWET